MTAQDALETLDSLEAEVDALVGLMHETDRKAKKLLEMNRALMKQCQALQAENKLLRGVLARKARMR